MSALILRIIALLACILVAKAQNQMVACTNAVNKPWPNPDNQYVYNVCVDGQIISLECPIGRIFVAGPYESIFGCVPIGMANWYNNYDYPDYYYPNNYNNNNNYPNNNYPNNNYPNNYYPNNNYPNNYYPDNYYPNNNYPNNYYPNNNYPNNYYPNNNNYPNNYNPNYYPNSNNNYPYNPIMYNEEVKAKN